jgi:2-polyprenyl-6-methoxyphenol hydroxylase-like FAD-dependent oxidoreductase
MKPKEITIVGGGLAGLTLGIALRQQQVPVTVWEVGRYPRHRVCGEFISGRGLATLARLGLQDKLLPAGGRWATSAAFYASGQRLVEQRLPEPALCLSRYVLDDLLAQVFCQLGGELRVNERWSKGDGGEGVVRATGRQVQASVHGWRWFGLKVHGRGGALEADLEMHFVNNGYVGLCRLNGEFNICGLFRSRTPLPQLARQWREMLCGEPGSKLREHLGDAVLEEKSFCSAAGLCVEPQRAGDGDECALGDALTMTPPITGNGMSMALESAELAVQPLISYCREERTWDETRREIATQCNRRFRHRLRAAALLHRTMFHSVARKFFPMFLPRFPGLVRVLFAQTR